MPSLSCFGALQVGHVVALESETKLQWLLVLLKTVKCPIFLLTVGELVELNNK